MPDFHFLTAVDWVLVAVLVLSMVVGAWRGLVFEVLSLMGWMLSFYAAQWFAPAVASWLPLKSAGDPIRHAAAFILVFIAVLLAAGLVTFLVKKAVAAVGLRPIDRTLGAAFGVLRGVVVLLAAAVVIDMTALKNSDWWRDSSGAGLLTGALHSIKPILPQPFARYLPGA